jgi:KDO2-lipid IV(A) lauroyltransferase
LPSTAIDKNYKCLFYAIVIFQKNITIDTYGVKHMKLIDKVTYLGLQLFISILGKIPLRTGTSIGNFLGAIWFSVDKKHKKITIDNLSHAYGQELSKKEIITLARKIFKNTARMIFEYAWLYNSVSKNNSKYFSIKGVEYLSAAHAKKKGVLLLSAHLGNWELGAALATFTNFPITVVYRKIKSKPIDLLIQKNRESFGVKVYPLHNAFDGVSQALKRGDLVGLLIDQNTGHNRGVFIDFFGRKACANTGLAKLALQTGAPVVPIFNYRENGKFIIEIQPELPVIRTGDIKNDILKNTQSQNTTIEKIVRKHPDQWFWIHKRWKTRPLHEKRLG